MAFRFPYTNFHALNLDWLIKKVKEIANAIPTKVSQLENDSGYITSAQAGQVLSVNGKTGVVVLGASDVGAKPSNYVAPVDSVNGKTGVVVLNASDVGAKPSNYAAPVDSVNGKTGVVVLNANDVGANTVTTSYVSQDTTTFTGTNPQAVVDRSLRLVHVTGNFTMAANKDGSTDVLLTGLPAPIANMFCLAMRYDATNYVPVLLRCVLETNGNLRKHYTGSLKAGDGFIVDILYFAGV